MGSIFTQFSCGESGTQITIELILGDPYLVNQRTEFDFYSRNSSNIWICISQKCSRGYICSSVLDLCSWIYYSVNVLRLLYLFYWKILRDLCVNSSKYIYFHWTKILFGLVSKSFQEKYPSGCVNFSKNKYSIICVVDSQLCCSSR